MGGILVYYNTDVRTDHFACNGLYNDRFVHSEQRRYEIGVCPYAERNL